jgi:arginyl-tRNA synthetase
LVRLEPGRDQAQTFAWPEQAPPPLIPLTLPQSGDPSAVAAWTVLCAASRREYAKIYDRLSIRGLEERGESFYNPLLPGVIEGLGPLAQVSDGATCVFLDEKRFKNKEGESLPLIVKKTDGGYNYATTDLAAIKQRVETEGADRVL